MSMSLSKSKSFVLAVVLSIVFNSLSFPNFSKPAGRETLVEISLDPFTKDNQGLYPVLSLANMSPPSPPDFRLSGDPEFWHCPPIGSLRCLLSLGLLTATCSLDQIKSKILTQKIRPKE